jgi:hypothetical protein
MKHKVFIIFLYLFLFAFLGIAVYAYADMLGFDRAREVGLPPIDVRTLIENIVLFLLSLASIIALGVLIWGAFMYMMSLGDESRAAHAKKIILYAIIGLLLTGGSFFIVREIGNLIAQR